MTLTAIEQALRALLDSSHIGGCKCSFSFSFLASCEKHRDRVAAKMARLVAGMIAEEREACAEIADRARRRSENAENEAGAEIANDIAEEIRLRARGHGRREGGGPRVMATPERQTGEHT